MAASRIITLTTDFGTSDGYVAAMKGVILSLAADACIVDISHDIPPQDIMSAAFVMRSAIGHFPAKTIHVAVVDPGVGTGRRGVAARNGDHYLIAPDNGILSLVLNGEPPDQIVQLDQVDAWLRPDPSATFHGRDIFAPAAGRLASGMQLSDIGSAVDELRHLQWALPIADEQGIQGWVVHVDRFGNCITNITRAHLKQHQLKRRVKCIAGSTILQGVHHTYADVEIGEPVALFQSDDFLEIAVNAGNAGELLSINKGAPVNVIFLDETE